MIITDVHTHSLFSNDGHSPLRDMVLTAKQMGLRYFGVADHFSYEFRADHILINGKESRYIDEPAYFKAGRELAEEVNDESFTLLIGAEIGYTATRRAIDDSIETVEKYNPDFVVNSVHTCRGLDAYRGAHFVGRDKQTAYKIYLECVRESLDVPYRYDIIPHFGYVSRKAPYGDNKFRYEEFAPEIDDILKTIIAKGVILEVNTSANGAGSEFLPDADILTRYYELGGRKISFASDAHDTSRIADKRDIVCEALKTVGFTYITVPNKGEYVHISL